MLRSNRTSLLCCLIAISLICAAFPETNTWSSVSAYAKKRQKRRKKRSINTWMPYLRQVAPPQVATNSQTPPQTTTPAPERAVRSARVPGVHVSPIKVSNNANAPAANVFTNPAPIEISAVNASSEPEPVIPYPSEIDVLGLSGVVTGISVTINGLTHSSPDDLDMLLVAPSGQSFHFWSDVGGSNPVTDITITVADDASRPLPDSAALVDGGTYLAFNADTDGDAFPVPAIGPPYAEPENVGSATFGSLFNGLTADQVSGTWSLFITDDTDGNGGSIARGWSLNISTAVPVTTAGQLIVSEFRLSGPNGADDEFIELYNTTGDRLRVQAADESGGLGVAASDGNTRCVVPNGTLIPAKGHYLCAHSSSSLANAADATYAAGIEENAGLAVFNNATGGLSYSLANRIDAVGASSETNALYREGTGYPPVSATGLEYAFYRDLRPGGVPKDTNNNDTDFLFVDTSGANAGAGQRLGAPGAENLASPLQQNENLLVTLMAPCVGASSAPNRVRDVTSDPENNSTFGTLSIRRVITNTTPNDITRLRFRVVDITTFPGAPGIADLRARTSSDSIEVDRCNLGGLVEIRGLTLETPPTQPLGGGFNSTLSAGIVTLESPLPANSSITVNILLGVQQTGYFRLFLNIEALP